jgi:hypothetical protein
MPPLMLLGTAVTMTVPMVGWIPYRGHGRRASTEMSASMLVPTFAAIALLQAGVVNDVDVLFVGPPTGAAGVVQPLGRSPPASDGE